MLKLLIFTALTSQQTHTNPAPNLPAELPRPPDSSQFSLKLRQYLACQLKPFQFHRNPLGGYVADGKCVPGKPHVMKNRVNR